MGDVFRLLQRVGYRAPQIPELVEAVLAAREPDADLGTLGRVGKAVLNVVQPGAGQHAEDLARSVGHAANLFLAQMRGEVIDAEARDVDVQPWGDFVRHLRALTWGVVVIFGAKGYGKTTLAVKLADVWRERTGYQVECVGLYPEDCPPWAHKIGMRRLVARMRKLARYLDQEEDEVDDGLTPDELRRKGKADPTLELIEPWEIEQMKRRIVVVDEAAMFFSSMSAAGQQDSREASRNLNNQARHLSSLFIFICQKISEMPDYLQDSAIQFYKWAGEEVVRKDYRQGQKRDNRERWLEVLTALNAVRVGTFVEPLPGNLSDRAKEAIRSAALAHRYYEPPLDDVRAWAYVVASDIGGHGYRGVVPFTPAKEGD